MRFLPILAFITVIFLVEACQSDVPSGFTRSKSGMVYKHHIKGDGEKPTVGCRVFYHVDFRREDSVITSSRMQGNPVDLTISPVDDNNFLREALMMMAVGDSLTMIRLKDSVRNPLPADFKSGDIIYIDLALKSFLSKEMVHKDKAKVLTEFTRSPLGTYLKWELETKNPKPKIGDGLVYNVQLKKGQSTVFSSYKNEMPNRMQIPGNINEVIKENPILEALTYMGKGDSLRIAVEYDSVPRLFKPEWGFQSGDIGVFEMSIATILTKEEVEREKAEFAAIQKAKQQEEEEKRLKNEPYRQRYEDVKKNTQQIVKDYKAGKIKPKSTIKGLKYMIVEQGTGPSAGEEGLVSVHYSGFLTDGTEFDSSFKRAKPIDFTLGQGHVIEGWDIGIDLLKEGGKAYFFIPPNLAYGELGSPPRIPGNSELVFYVELVQVTL